MRSVDIYSRTSQYEFNSFHDRAHIAIYSFYKSIFTIEINWNIINLLQPKIFFYGFLKQKVHIVDILRSYWLAKSTTRTPLMVFNYFLQLL